MLLTDSVGPVAGAVSEAGEKRDILSTFIGSIAPSRRYAVKVMSHLYPFPAMIGSETSTVPTEGKSSSSALTIKLDALASIGAVYSSL